jgi:hypothetical protein
MFRFAADRESNGLSFRKVQADMSPEQGWDRIWFIAGGAIAFVVAVPIAYVIRDKLCERRMRRHFDDTRGRRGRAKDRGQA